jgi:UPF0755 protein
MGDRFERGAARPLRAYEQDYGAGEYDKPGDYGAGEHGLAEYPAGERGAPGDYGPEDYGAPGDYGPEDYGARGDYGPEDYGAPGDYGGHGEYTPDDYGAGGYLPEEGYADHEHPGVGYYPDHDHPGAGYYPDDDHPGAGYYPDDEPEASGYAYGAAPAARQGAHRRRRRRHHGHRLLTVLGIVVVVVILAAGGIAWWAKDQISPGGKRGPSVEVVIPAGASRAQIGRILAGKGVIHSATLFHYYVALKGTATLYPGTYRLPKNDSYAAAIAALENPPPIVQDRLTIPEGFTIDEMAVVVSKLPHSHITAAQFVAAATNGQIRSPYEPAGTRNLEGLLFPATYQIRQGSTAGDVVQQMVDAFDTNAAEANLTAGAAHLALTPYQVVIVASMVEREAKRPQDRGPIASVIYNRLKDGMTLGIDATLLYGLHTTNYNVNPETPNPYNTRLHTGLPPTPISNPGLASLEAAANPPATSYLYYAVTGPGGQTSFASTAAGFYQIQAQCRQAGYCS